MILLGRIEAAALDPGSNRRLEQMSGSESGDECLGEASLLGILREDRRPVAGADIGRLTVHLRRVVRDSEVDLEELSIADAGGIVGDLHRFRMTGSFGTDGVVICVA